MARSNAPKSKTNLLIGGIVGIVAVLVVMAVLISKLSAPTVGGSTTFPNPALNSTSLTFIPDLGSTNISTKLSVLQQNLKAGDNVFIGGTDPTAINNLKSSFKQGVNVYATQGYRKPSDFIATVPTLPKGYDMFYLDYEQGDNYSGSEFTSNQTQVFSIFDECRNAVNQYNIKTGSSAKFFATPNYMQIKSKNPNFDWSLLPLHEDLVWIQFQQYEHHQGIGNVAGQVVEQIKATNNSIYVIVQISVYSKYNYTVQDAVEAMNELKDYPVNSFELFVGPDVADLQSFLNVIQR